MASLCVINFKNYKIFVLWFPISAELRENGAAKRHLSFLFSAHLPDFKGNPFHSWWCACLWAHDGLLWE